MPLSSLRRLLIVFIGLTAGSCLPSPSLYASGGGALRGFVTDSTNGEAITYANVLIKGSTIGITTNTRGYYFIPSIPPGKHTAIVSCIGYRTNYVAVTIREDEITDCNVHLVPGAIELEEVAVVGESQVRLNETDLGLQKISVREIEIVPQAIESDIFRVLQLIPGVSSTGDVTAKYYVRGGAADQNLVLLNGAPVYNPFHALGIFSVIDPEMISTLEFFKGGFTSDYGGRLSSILNVVTRDGNKKSYHASGQAGLVSGKVAVEGPIPDGSFLATGRKSYYGKILKNFLSGQEAPFDFWDVSFKVNSANQHISDVGKFVLHGFFSRDDVSNHDPLLEDYFVTNSILGINWHKVWASPLYSVVTLSYSGFRAEVLPNESKSKPRTNTVYDVTNNWDFTYVYDSRDEFAFGLQNKFLKTQLHLVNVYDVKTALDEQGWDVNAYAEYRYKRWEAFRLNLGVRLKFVALTEYRPFLFEPRISSTYRPFPAVALKAAVGWYSQELTSLSNENDLISIFEPLVIIPSYLSSSEAAHMMAGVEANLTDKFSIELEGYYKPSTNLVDLNERKYTSGIRDFVNVDGKSYGLEFFLRYQPASMSLQVSYSLGWVYKINGDVLSVPRYDSRHSVNALLSYDFGAGWQASTVWSLRSGMPFTPIAGYYDRLTIDPWSPSAAFNPHTPVILWGERNSERLPFYHRLDISCSKKFHVDLAQFAISASVINVYDRKNIFYFDRDTGKEVYMLRFTPSITLRVEI